MNGLEQVKMLRISLAAAAIALASLLPAQARAQTPDARELLAQVRATQSAQNQEFSGRLRTSDSTRKLIVPFRLSMQGDTITYAFTGPEEALILRLGEKGSRLERAAGSGRARSVTTAQYDTSVRGTDLTYEDLTLQFLYWNNSRVLGKDQLGTSTCWVIQALPPGKGSSQYEYVRLWVEKSGALLKAECFAGGKLAKRFEVRNVQRSPSGKGFILKSMRIQKMDERGRDRSPTYLDVRPI